MTETILFFVCFMGVVFLLAHPLEVFPAENKESYFHGSVD